MQKVTTVGIDLAKNVFYLEGVNANGKVVLRRTVRRGEVNDGPARRLLTAWPTRPVRST